MANDRKPEDPGKPEDKDKKPGPEPLGGGNGDPPGGGGGGSKP